MKVLELCRDPADPRRGCRGHDCRCRGAYQTRFTTTWRGPRAGEVEVRCRWCQRSYVGPVQAVTYWIVCYVCGRHTRIAGASRIGTWLWRAFGRREGYNVWGAWR